MYDYTAGKKDWLAAGLPVEGERSADKRVGNVMQTQVPTCSIDARVQDLATDIGSSGFFVVLDSDSVVHGVAWAHDLDEAEADRPVAELMQLGPTTRRASLSLDKARETIREGNVDRLVITDPSGHFLGVVFEDDLKG